VVEIYDELCKFLQSSFELPVAQEGTVPRKDSETWSIPLGTHLVTAAPLARATEASAERFLGCGWTLHFPPAHLARMTQDTSIQSPLGTLHMSCFEGSQLKERSGAAFSKAALD
jgi:hypothetical protein